jgi:hypothetical protein
MRVHRRLALSIALAAALVGLCLPAGAQAAFGIDTFTTTFTNEDESPDTLAGSHPYEFTTHIVLNQDAEGHREGTLQKLLIELPPGLVGDPMSLPRCSRAAFDSGFLPLCPGESQVGIAEIELNQGGIIGHPAVYNLTPTLGSAATLGLSIDDNNGLLNASVRTAEDGKDYGVNITDPALPVAHELQQISARIWGVPMAKAHDLQRFCPPEGPESVGENCSSAAPPAAFLSLPTRCNEALQTRLVVHSTEGEEDEAIASAPALRGCEAIPFEPQIAAQPETAAADSPTGLAVGVTIPQSRDPKQRATAHLKDTVVTLPQGLAVNASAASGRTACSLAQIDLSGPGPANCPDASKVGTVTVTSPLVDHSLPGSVYLARQGENPFGSLIALYIALDDPLTGVVVKQAIEVLPDPITGRLTAFTPNTPQVPFEHLDFNFFGGPRAALTTPPTCGTYTTQALFTPWSAPEGKTATRSDSFALSEGAHGGPCPASEAQMPFAPGFEAGTSAPLAGAYSPFVLKVSRENGSQRLSALNVTLPPGLAAKLAGVAECSEPQIAAAIARKEPGEGAAELANPSCPKSSEVGVVNVGAGSGAPLYVQGHAYLAGPYKGAPLSMAIITPAVAGPFDLGVVVVRTALFVDETTGQVSAKSDPIPQILQGIPLALRSVAVRLDRPRFALNPTNCSEKQISGQAISPLGAAAPLKARFAVSGCRGLEFSPQIALRFKGSTSRRAHPALRAVLTRPEGQANFGKVSVTLPASQFVDPNHVGNPCTRPKFAEGKCPPISELGTVTAYTPLLEKPLTGKVYFRANGGERTLPDVVADLHGQVHFVLVGFVDTIVHGESSRVRTTFAQNPDAPVSKVVIELKGGKRHGVLISSQNLCKTRVSQRALVKMEGQNGKAHNSEPLIANGCPKQKPKRSARHRGR